MSSKFQVCPRCKGEGKITNPSLSVWTNRDRDEDPEGFRLMMQGAYDVSCTCCHGKRVVTKEELEYFKEQKEESRTRAYENGDWETISNGSYL